MKTSLIVPFGLALACVLGSATARDNPRRAAAPAAAAAPAPVAPQRQKSDELISVKVSLLKQGAEVSSFTSYLSDGDAAVYCSGSMKGPEGLYWRMFVRADLQQGADGVLELTVEDLKLIKGLDDGKSIEIFSSTQPSDGVGNYLCGELQGMQLRVDIKKIPKSSLRPQS